MAQVTELITKFSFIGSTMPLFNFNSRLGTSIKSAALFVAAFAGASAAVASWSDSILKSLDPLAQMEKRTGVAAGRIQELGYAATQSGSTIEAMSGTMLSLSQTIGNAAIRGSEDFSRLGISVRHASGEIKNADQILSDVANRFQSLNLSMQEKETIASGLGIDATLVQMLSRSSSEMADLAREAQRYGVLTAGQSDQIIAYNDALSRQQFAISAVKNQIVIALAPALTDLADKFSDLIVNNKEWIAGAAAKTVEIAVELFDGFKNVSGAIFEMINALTGGHGKAATIITALTAFAIGNPISAGIIATALVVDDLIVAMTGGQSVIADFFDEFLNVDVVEGIKDLVGYLERVADTVKSLTGNSSYDPAQIPKHMSDQFSMVPGEDGLVLVPKSQSVAIQQDIKIEINTNDPMAAGQAVNDGLQEQMRNATTQSNLGGE